MCNFNRISNLIIAAQIAFLASLAIVIGAIALGSNPFTSAANIPLMITCAVLAAAATGLLAGAAASLEQCTSGPCGSTAESLRTSLFLLMASMATYSLALVALALIAGIPFVGSAAALTVSLGAVSLATAFAAMTSGALTNTIQAFNRCMNDQSQGNNNSTTVIIVLGAATVLAAVIVGGSAGIANGVVPCVGSTCKWSL